MTNPTPRDSAQLPCGFCAARRLQPITETLPAELRTMADVAESAGKPHWANAMREASRQLIRARNVEVAAAALAADIESMSGDRIIPIARSATMLADALACPF